MKDPEGCYEKFAVAYANGSPVPPGKNFTLNFATDPHAQVAILAYAESVEKENPVLAADLRRELAEVLGS